MNTSKFIYPASGLLLTSGMCFAQERDAVATTERPNVIYLLCDDMGYSDIEAYGQQMISTPNLNRLVNQGMTFTRECPLASLVDDRPTHRPHQNPWQ